MIKKIISICLLLSVFTCITPVLAINDKIFDYEFQRLSKDQYQHKKVLKKYDSYLLNIENKTNKAILLTSESTVLYVNNNGETLENETRRDIYRKIRRKDIGKYYSIGLPCIAVGGLITGATFGLGIPVAIGLGIIGTRPANKATKENYQLAYELYQSRSLPLRFEPKELNQILLLIPKGESINKIIITNVVIEKSNKKFNINLDIATKE